MSLINRLTKNQSLSPVKLIVLFYFFAILISTFLLKLPLFWQEGQTLSLFDSLFTSISAISVTGLSVISIAEVFNTMGYFVFSIILQFGGIGIMTFGMTIYVILGKKIGMRERQLISIDLNQSTLSGLVSMMLKILKTIVAIEIIGMFLLSIRYIGFFDTWQEALVQAYFGAVSATTNAGFDITGTSLIPFADDYYVQIVQISLMIFGGIGFPVLLELQQWFLQKRESKRLFKFSTFVKLTTITYFLLVIVGTLIIFLLEWNHVFSDHSLQESALGSLFYSVSARNAGLSTLNANDFSASTLIVISALMFIGASPSSVGGGIRTTTFAIMILAIYNYAKGRQTIKIFRREISTRDIIRSFIVGITALALCFSAIFTLTITEPFSIMALAVEVFSAFGTTGLSLGITADLSVVGRIVIMIMMFIGRIGIFSFLFIISGPPTKDLYRYPEAQMPIG